MMHVRSRAGTVHVRVAIVERYPLVRAAITDLLGAAGDVEVAAAEPSVAAILETMQADPADVVLVRAALAGEELVPSVQRLKREWPTSAVVVMGHRRDDNELFWAIQSGAAAHVGDGIRPDELARVIRSAAAGEYLIDAEIAARPVVARRVLDAFREASYGAVVLDGDLPRRAMTRLTPREIEILSAISEGMSTREIAAALSISPYTVSNTVKSVLRKLAVNNRTRAVLLALRDGWLPIATARDATQN
jgi:DNA-binding NarL/FixJ family response regulator